VAKDLTFFPRLNLPPEQPSIDDQEVPIVDDDEVPEPPNIDDLRLDEDPEKDLITLCFDCVDVGYFNKNLDPFRDFYAKVRGRTSTVTRAT